MFEDFGEPWAGACCYLDESPLWGAIKIKSKRHNYPLILMMVSWTGYSGGWLETGQACSGTAGSTSKKCSSLHVAILHDIFYFQKTPCWCFAGTCLFLVGPGVFQTQFSWREIGKRTRSSLIWSKSYQFATLGPKITCLLIFHPNSGWIVEFYYFL